MKQVGRTPVNVAESGLPTSQMEAPCGLGPWSRLKAATHKAHTKGI